MFLLDTGRIFLMFGYAWRTYCVSQLWGDKSTEHRNMASVACTWTMAESEPVSPCLAVLGYLEAHGPRSGQLEGLQLG